MATENDEMMAMQLVDRECPRYDDHENGAKRDKHGKFVEFDDVVVVIAGLLREQRETASKLEALKDAVADAMNDLNRANKEAA